jgi:GH15 family glucan-1,4-alpha-glucosidase
MDRTDRIAASVTAMLKHQSAYGSFVASPDIGQYQFCWLRDSSFISLALDVAGEQAATARYHRWVAGALAPLRPAMADAAALASYPGAARLLPPARFALDGSTTRDDWPNFQIDGYGAWIWSLREHLRLGGDRRLLDELRATVDATWRYLDALALHPCFDVWEEHGDRVHTSTLACVRAGLSAAADLLDEPRAAERAAEVESFLLALADRHGRFPKSTSDEAVDASTLWLCVPFGIVTPAQPAMAATVDAIAAELDLDGGIRRYPGDTFYGGGAWPVLTASLGLYRLAAGDRRAADECLAWVEARFDAEGRLGEQFGGERVNPAMYREWIQRWGHPARDLLWSHAMYVLLALAAGLSPHPRRSTPCHDISRGPRPCDVTVPAWPPARSAAPRSP